MNNMPEQELILAVQGNQTEEVVRLLDEENVDVDSADSEVSVFIVV